MRGLDDNERHWTDKQLQQVEIPHDLIDRLKAIGEDHRNLLDAALCTVPIPAGLLDRIKAVPSAMHLDSQLQAVLVPDQFPESLKKIPAETAIDDQLVDVRIPERLVEHIREVLPHDRAAGATIPTDPEQVTMIDEFTCPEPPPVQIRRPAAQLLSSPAPQMNPGDQREPGIWRESLNAQGSMTVQPSVKTAVDPTRPRPRPPLSRRVAYWATAATLWIALGIAQLAALTGILVSSLARHPADHPHPIQLIVDSSLPASMKTPTELGDVHLHPAPAPMEHVFTNTETETDREIVWPAPNPATELAAPDPVHAVSEHDNSTLLGMPFLDRPDRSVQRMAKPEIQGIAPPPIREYDMLALARTGIHPFILPNSHHLLRSITIPIITATDDFDSVQHTLLAGESPDPSTIHTEDFLAAIDYEFSPPTSSPLQLHVTGGPSPWDQERRQLLQIALQATDLSTIDRPGRSLIVILDPSIDTLGCDCFALLHAGLARLNAAMGPHDCITVLVAGPKPTPLVVDMERDRLQELLEMAAHLRPSPSTDIPAALASASEYLAHENPSSAGQVLLITGSREPAQNSARMEQAIHSIVARNGHFHTLQLGVWSANLAQLETWTRLGGGRAYYAPRQAEFYHTFFELLSAESACIAKRVRLTVTFRPDSVTRYRLLGHEARGAGGLIDGPLEVDLYVNDTATALVEVELQPSRSQEIADIQLEWWDPETDMFQQTVHVVHRSHFAPTFVEAAPSFQLATLAAATAERLRNSPYLSDNFGWDAIIQLADSVHPVLYDNRSLQEWADLLVALQRRRP